MGTPFPTFTAELSSLRDFRDHSLATAVLEAIESANPTLMPAKFGPYQPLKSRYSSATKDEVLAVWSNEVCRVDGQPADSSVLLMDGKEPSRAAYMVSWSKGESRFNSLSVGVDLDYVTAGDGLNHFLALVRKLAAITDAVFGCVQDVGLPGWEPLYDLRLRLPVPGWKLFFGRPYVHLFGEDKLASAPCHQVQRLESGHFELTVSENPVQAPSPEQIRSLVQHLGPDAFMEPGKSSRSYKTGKAPNFDFSDILRD